MFVSWVFLIHSTKMSWSSSPNISLSCYTDCTLHIGMLFSNWYNTYLYQAYAYSVLSLYFSQSLKGYGMLHLHKIGRPAQWRNIWEVKISDLPTFIAYVISKASKMCFIPYKGTKIHMARNIFYIHEVEINVIFSNSLVEVVKSHHSNF